MNTTRIHEALIQKTSFNAAVKHITTVTAIVERFEKQENLADILKEYIDEKLLTPDAALSIINLLLVNKYKYVCGAKNLSAVTDSLAKIPTSAGKWNAVDLVVVYHHPDLGIVILNPKNPDSIAQIDRLNRFEMVTVYAGAFTKAISEETAQKAIKVLIGLFETGQAKNESGLLTGPCKYQAPKPKAAAKPKAEKKASNQKAKPAVAKKTGQGKAPAPAPVKEVVSKHRRMTPMYAVPVTNELFHNGNVEAWKRIIESYKASHPDLDVLVYYDGERIANLNSLFKWGKVKHGSVIQFAVAGDNIRDVAKLQRYLAQGASPGFEAFLKGSVNSVLSLF